MFIAILFGLLLLYLLTGFVANFYIVWFLSRRTNVHVEIFECDCDECKVVEEDKKKKLEENK